jgi:hypothetical protein
VSSDAFPGRDHAAGIDGESEDGGRELFKPETELPDSEAVEPELDE